MLFRSNWLKSCPVLMPILPEISWSASVAQMDKIKAQSREYPKFTPARVQTVTVPGPMNAAAMTGPGPRFLKNREIDKLKVFCKIEI